MGLNLVAGIGVKRSNSMIIIFGIRMLCIGIGTAHFKSQKRAIAYKNIFRSN